MRDTPLNRAAWQLGRVIGFIWYPSTFLIVAYGAWLAAEAVWGQ